MASETEGFIVYEAPEEKTYESEESTTIQSQTKLYSRFLTKVTVICVAIMEKCIN